MLSQEAFKKITLWMGVLIILGIIGIAIYMFINVQEIKLLNSNVCALCQKWTGAICTKGGSFGFPQVAPRFEILNITTK